MGPPGPPGVRPPPGGGALLVLLAATAATAPAARAQDVTALQATMTVGFDSQDAGGGYLAQQLGYEQNDSTGNLSPAQFEYPASSAAAAAYTVRGIYLRQEGNPNTTPGIVATGFGFIVRGAVTTPKGGG